MHELQSQNIPFHGIAYSEDLTEMFPRAKQRLNETQELARDASAISNRNVRLQETHKRARTMGIYGSQVSVLIYMQIIL
jgi:hypothetical protein